MSEEEASNPFLPPPETEPAPSRPEPEVDPALNLQGDNYRSMSYDVRRNAPPFDWKTFLRWMSFGVTSLLAFIAFMVWVLFQVFDASSGSMAALITAIVLTILAVYLGRVAMRKR
jgi:polyferredoxin